MDLVDDYSFDRSQSFASRRGQKKIEAFRGGNEDLARVPSKSGSVFLWCIAGPYTYSRDSNFNPFPPCHLSYTGKWYTEIPLHIYGESLQR
jgi:hypothetical protein